MDMERASRNMERGMNMERPMNMERGMSMERPTAMERGRAHQRRPNEMSSSRDSFPSMDRSWGHRHSGPDLRQGEGNPMYQDRGPGMGQRQVVGDAVTIHQDMGRGQGAGQGRQGQGMEQRQGVGDVISTYQDRDQGQGAAQRPSMGQGWMPQPVPQPVPHPSQPTRNNY